ncbi:hypothetical protein ACHAXT_005455 [Thalassiosira profunda]
MPIFSEYNHAKGLLYLLCFAFVVCTAVAVVLEPCMALPCDLESTSGFPNVMYRHDPCQTSTRYLRLMGLTPRECSFGRHFVVAAILGSVIGYERKQADRPAGIRTMSVVSLAAALFTVNSTFVFQAGPMHWDPVSAAVPSGVGFLGAGLIVKDIYKDLDGETAHMVKGLNTAASVWLSAADTLASIPLATRSIVGVCILIYAYQLLFDPPLHHFTMCPNLVLYQHEFYRIITSALFHANLMHIAMNMMSTMAIGGSLERQLGTLMLGITISWGILLTSAIYILISWLLHLIFGYEGMMLQHSVGFSGVIFQLSVLESSLSPNRTRSVFGVFTVSSKMYPWALLVALQFIMPQISFLGHLSGILVGTLQYFGMLDKIFPSETKWI